MISLVLLQHNHSDYTITALNSILEGDLVPDEIVMVDNNSTDEHRAALDHLDVTKIYLEENVGYVRGTNVGWLAASGDYIILCNNDIALAKSCLFNLVESTKSDASIGWASAVYTAGPWRNCVASGVPSHIVAELDRSMGVDRGSLNSWANTLPARSVNYCNVTEATVFCVTRKATELVGVFDSSLHYHHSHDYSIRLFDNGFKTAVANTAVFWHNYTHPTIRNQKDFDFNKELTAATTTMDKKYGGRWRGWA